MAAGSGAISLSARRHHTGTSSSVNRRPLRHSNHPTGRHATATDRRAAAGPTSAGTAQRPRPAHPGRPSHRTDVRKRPRSHGQARFPRLGRRQHHVLTSPDGVDDDDLRRQHVTYRGGIDEEHVSERVRSPPATRRRLGERLDAPAGAGRLRAASARISPAAVWRGRGTCAGCGEEEPCKLDHAADPPG